MERGHRAEAGTSAWKATVTIAGRRHVLGGRVDGARRRYPCVIGADGHRTVNTVDSARAVQLWSMPGPHIT